MAIITYFVLVKVVFASPVSIVLLPLENISRDAEQEWFTEGMTDAYNYRPGPYKRIDIISRSSAMKYKSSNKSSAEIAAELGVSYIIEGSVVRIEDQVKITVRLIDASKKRVYVGSGISA